MKKILIAFLVLLGLTACQPLITPKAAPNGDPIVQPGDSLYYFTVITKDSNGTSRRNNIIVELTITSTDENFPRVHISDGFEGGQFLYGPVAVSATYTAPISVHFWAHFPWISIGDTVSCAVTKRGQETPIAANTIRVDRGSPESVIAKCDTVIYPQ